jgi:hypothetical protein
MLLRTTYCGFLLRNYYYLGMFWVTIALGFGGAFVSLAVIDKVLSLLYLIDETEEALLLPVFIFDRTYWRLVPGFLGDLFPLGLGERLLPLSDEMLSLLELSFLFFADSLNLLVSLNYSSTYSSPPSPPGLLITILGLLAASCCAYFD